MSAINHIGSTRHAVIAFAHNDWRGPWMNRQQILSRLGTRGWFVTYSTGALSVWDPGTPRWKRAPWRARFEETDGIRLDVPGRLPLRWPTVGAFDRMMVRYHAKRLAKQDRSCNERKVIAYLFHPFFLSYVDYLSADYLVIHAYDSYTKLPGWTSDQEVMLSRSIKQANLVIASSEAIARFLPNSDGRSIKILSNAVDPAVFDPFILRPCPDDLSVIPHPRIGYTGTVNEKVDFAMIAKVALQRSSWHWVLVGHDSYESRSFKSTNPELIDAHLKCRNLPNVHFLGSKNPADLPAYIGHMDVNVMCYRTDGVGWWESGDPIKCYEYLAMTKPIVSANIENVRRFSDVVNIANSTDEWIAAIEGALFASGIGTPAQRRAAAIENTWDQRADKLETWLFEMLAS